MRTLTNDSHAELIYVLAKWPTNDPPGAAILILRLLGRGAIVVSRERAHDRDVRVFMRDGAWRALVPSGLRGPELAMALARAIARWYVLAHLPDDTSTPDIDDIAAAIVLPYAAIRIVVAKVGCNASAIGAWLAVPSEIVSLRLHQAGVTSGSGFYPRTLSADHAPPESSR